MTLWTAIYINVIKKMLLTFRCEDDLLVASFLSTTKFALTSELVGGAAQEHPQIIGVDGEDRQSRLPCRRAQLSRHL